MKSKSFSALPMISTVVLLIAGLSLWEIGTHTGGIDPFFFSSPSRVWADFLNLFTQGLVLRHLSATLEEAAIGLGFGCVLGTATGFLLGRHKNLSAAVMPLLAALNGLPKLALAPLLIFWLGIGLKSKALVAGIMVYFVFTFNLYAGYNSVDPQLVNAVRLLGGSQKQIMRHVVWPFCLPWFLTGLRTGVGMALSGAIVGEYLGSTRGLGWLISNASSSYNITRVLSCLLLIILLIVGLDSLQRLWARALLKWRPTSGSSR